MKSVPQHACEACNELVETIRQLKHELSRVKRLPLAEIPGELNLLQASFGALEAQAAEMKTFVCVSFATHAVASHADVIPPARVASEEIETEAPRRQDELCIWPMNPNPNHALAGAMATFSDLCT